MRVTFSSMSPTTIIPTSIPANITSKIINDRYLSDIFLKKDDVNDQDVSKILKDIRITNINHVIIAHLNVNSFVDKIDSMQVNYSW